MTAEMPRFIIPAPNQIARRRYVEDRTPTWHGAFPFVDEMASAPETVDLACMFTAFLRPKVVVEAGTYMGHMAAALAMTMFQLKYVGTIHTADPFEAGFARIIEQNPKLNDYVRYSNGDYLEMLAGVTEPIDMAFIDASHKDNPHMRLEHTEATMEKMRPGALLFIDDTAAQDWEDAKVLRNRANVFLEPHRGLCILQKPYDPSSPFAKE